MTLSAVHFRTSSVVEGAPLCPLSRPRVLSTATKALLSVFHMTEVFLRRKSLRHRKSFGWRHSCLPEKWKWSGKGEESSPPRGWTRIETLRLRV